MAWMQDPEHGIDARPKTQAQGSNQQEEEHSR